MNIKQNSLAMSLSLLPKAMQARNTKNKFFHFAFCFQKNKLLAIGQNNPEKTHTQAMLLSKKFGITNRYPYHHAETDALAKIWNKHYINNNVSLVIIRLNKHGQLRNSKPCTRCNKIIKSLGINKVYWSIDNGFNK